MPGSGIFDQHSNLASLFAGAERLGTRARSNPLSTHRLYASWMDLPIRSHVNEKLGEEELVMNGKNSLGAQMPKTDARVEEQFSLSLVSLAKVLRGEIAMGPTDGGGAERSGCQSNGEAAA